MSPPPQLKLTYLEIAALGELTRLVLHYGGVPFEDVRVNYETLTAIKPTLPLGNVPTLEVDGVVYSQSMAIARYAAKISGLSPDEPMDALYADMISETLLEFNNAMNSVRYDGSMACINEAKVQPLLEEQLPKYFTALETRVRGQFFLGDQASCADVHLFNVVENELKWTFGPVDLSAFPKLTSIVELVRANPGVAAYIAKQGQIESFDSFRPKWAAYYGCK